MRDYIWLIPAVPLLAAAVNFVAGRRLPDRFTGWFAVACVAASWVVSLIVSAQVLEGQRLDYNLYTWVPSGSFQATIGFYVDPLAAVMLFVVTTISLLVHVYSIGYMHRDPGFYRFFSYLPLFTFSMLLLVLANNYLELYLSWELVGLCSYLLIGFWYEKRSASQAALKAFIVNRVGDFGFGLGVVFVFVAFGTLAYAPVFASVHTVAPGALTIIALLLLAGAMGKSAQWPLHTWLPDAMEGPTPVSALIHAATMVTAGVYLVARSHPIFQAAPGALGWVTVIGLVTALVGATIALVHPDIKHVIAYSTISQLGYMFFACGIGAYALAIFHLFTHAFFKALLFLSAGSVMHSLDNETDMHRMGGLRRHMPVTFATMVSGALALAGLPVFAGFWSKDGILGFAFEQGNYWVYALGTIAAFFTAFYITRLISLTFLGEPRYDTDRLHPHESPKVMTIPLAILGVCSLVAGFAGFPPGQGFLDKMLDPVLDTPAVEHGFTPTTIGLMAFATLVAVSGIGLALAMYAWRVPALDPQLWTRRLGALYRLLSNKYYYDDLYRALFVRPAITIGRALWRLDVEGVDGSVGEVAEGVSEAGRALRRLQTGFVGNYALAIGIGVIALVAYLFWPR